MQLEKILLAALTALAVAPAVAADVGVSVSVGQPGFYGHIEIGSFPQPQVIYPKPVVIQRVPAGVVYEPIYLRVPPGHAKNWKKHCRKYDACGRPVYFVRDDWYQNVYVPEYRNRHGEGREKDKHHGDDDHHDEGHGKHHGKGHDKD